MLVPMILTVLFYLCALGAAVEAYVHFPQWSSDWAVFAPEDDKLIHLPSALLSYVSLLLLIVASTSAWLFCIASQVRSRFRNSSILLAIAVAICLSYYVRFERVRLQYLRAVFRTSERTRQDFVDAVTRDDIVTVTRLLDAGADPNCYAVVCTNHYEMPPTALIAALGKKNHAMVRLLLSRGANPNVVGDLHFPLEEAIDGTDKTSVELLLKAGADVNKQGDSEWNPLEVAAQFGGESIVTLLLRYHPELITKEVNGMTPEQAVTKYGDKRAAHLLRNAEGKMHPPSIP